MKRETMLKKPSTALKKYYWEYVFSPYIRQRDKGVCFTCGKVLPWKEQHAGHFRHGKHSPVAFDEINVNCQCATCNTFKHGNLSIYTLRLVDKYGREKVDEVIRQSRLVKKWKSSELVDLIEKYREKLKVY